MSSGWSPVVFAEWKRSTPSIIYTDHAVTVRLSTLPITLLSVYLSKNLFCVYVGYISFLSIFSACPLFPLMLLVRTEYFIRLTCSLKQNSPCDAM